MEIQSSLDSNTHKNLVKSPRKILVPSDDGERIIGQIKNGVFIKTNWHSSKHICYKHRAIGIDKGAFVNYVQPLATLILVPDKTTRRTYKVSVDEFQHRCFEDNLGCWGVQLFLHIEAWQVDGGWI